MCVRAALVLSAAMAVHGMAFADGADDYGQQAPKQYQNGQSLGSALGGLFNALDKGTAKTGEVVGSGFGFLAKLANKIPSSDGDLHYQNVALMENSAGEVPNPQINLLGKAKNTGEVEIVGKSTQEVIVGMQMMMKAVHDIETGIASSDAKDLKDASARPSRVVAKFDASNVAQSMDMLNKLAATQGMGIAQEKKDGKVVYVFIAKKSIIAALNANPDLKAISKERGVTSADIDGFLKTYKPEAKPTQNFQPSGYANNAFAQERLRASVTNAVNDGMQRAFRK